MLPRVTFALFRRASTRTLVLAIGLIALVAVPAQAQDSGSFIGDTYKSESRALPDGSTAEFFWYRQGFTGPEGSNHPFANAASDCMGFMIVTADGVTQSGSGSCHSQSVDGASGASAWWRVTAVGTSQCPAVCGEYGLYGGYGRHAGAAGTGTWVRSAVFQNGVSIGTWQAK